MSNPFSSLSGAPKRESKPRTSGLNILYDYGIPLRNLESLFSYAEHIDAIEIGDAAVFVLDDLKERVALCKAHGIIPFLSGLVFEVFLRANKIEDYLALCKEASIETFHVSDGSITVPHAQKCMYIEKFSKLGAVYTRIGSKDTA